MQGEGRRSARRDDEQKNSRRREEKWTNVERQDTGTSNSSENVGSSSLEEGLGSLLGEDLGSSVEHRLVVDLGETQRRERDQGVSNTLTATNSRSKGCEPWLRRSSSGKGKGRKTKVSKPRRRENEVGSRD